MALSHILPAFLVLAFSQQGQLPPAEEVTAEALHELGGFLEGIVFGDDGTVYVSDVPGGGVYRFGPSTEPEAWATSGAPNGHKILEDGTHILADMDDGAVLRFSSSGSPIEPSINTSEVTPLADGLLDGITLHGDGNLYVAVHGDGRIFVISPEGEVLRDRGRVPWGQGITS